MPSLEVARRISETKNNGAKTIGQIHKENADWAMEQTWASDIQSKVCYIYDYFHDDQPRLKDHMTYENTTKNRIDAKFIVKSHQSLDKDQVEYYLQFKPSQKNEFTENDDLYYFETDYRKRYGVEWPIGQYCDIPDEKGIYRKWMICNIEISNQFTKYLILPCNFEMMWIETEGQNRFKRRMWAATRSQKSYTIGTYTDYRFTRPDNQEKIWLPLNSITENLWYTNEEDRNMRAIISAPTKYPIVWTITKVENINPIGLQCLTLYQNYFDKNRDYIEKDKTGRIIGMWADYYSTSIEPTEPVTVNPDTTIISAKILASSQTIKVGGSYKTLSIQITNKDEIDITNDYTTATYTWTCDIDGIDMKDKVKWLNTSEFNKIKLKFTDDRSYLGKILHVVCTVVKRRENVGRETYNCEMNFELII